MDGSNDFDFLIGKWRVGHRRLKARLVGCDEWEVFDGTSEMRLLFGGCANVDDHLLILPGRSYRGASLRSFDPATESWAIWWLDSLTPHRLDVPVVGRFNDGVGTFYAEEFLEDKPIRLRFLWLHRETGTPRWEQAMSSDRGNNWETNWIMEFARA